MLRLCYVIGSTGVATFRKYALPSTVHWIHLTLWLVLFLANAIDVAASWYAFSLGCDELNPLMDLIYRKFGMNGIILFKSFWLLAVFPLLRHLNGWVMGLFVLCCCMYSGLAVIHIFNIFQTMV